MKTAKEKALDWLKSQGAIYNDDTVNNLAILLKEQDRDTRHACVEAILQIDRNRGLISMTQAEHACMNVKAV